MNICMIVHNNVTRDGRVLREAGSLQDAGHSVTVLGLLDNELSSPVEYLENGVRVFRIMWQANAYRRLIWSSILRVLPVLAVLALIIAGIVVGLKALFAPGGPVARAFGWLGATVMLTTRWSLLDAAYALAMLLLAAGVAYLLWRALRSYLGLFGKGAQFRADEEDMIRRYASALFKEGALDDSDFPGLKSRIPSWVPDFVLELALEPLSWFGGGAGRFALLRYRSREMTGLPSASRPTSSIATIA